MAAAVDLTLITKTIIARTGGLKNWPGRSSDVDPAGLLPRLVACRREFVAGVRRGMPRPYTTGFVAAGQARPSITISPRRTTNDAKAVQCPALYASLGARATTSGGRPHSRD